MRSKPVSRELVAPPFSFPRGIANLNLAYGAECGVDAMAPTPAGFHDVFGNLWQWCEDFFAALPGSNGVHVYCE